MGEKLSPRGEFDTPTGYVLLGWIPIVNDRLKLGVRRLVVGLEIECWAFCSANIPLVISVLVVPFSSGRGRGES